MSLTLEIDERGGDQALVADKIDVTVGERVLVKDFSAVARRSDVVALVGPNGAGKTTLLATLLGDRTPGARRGEARRLGHGRVVPPGPGPGAEGQDDLRLHRRPAARNGPAGGSRTISARSASPATRCCATPSVLSGGERARVALALITLARANLLILDEPTNHLDVESIEALEDALEEYEGTVILVSHDRAFLRELSTRVWAFDGTHLEDYGGPFVEWEQHAAERAARRTAAQAVAAAAARKAARAEAAKAPGAERRFTAAHRRARRDGA